MRRTLLFPLAALVVASYQERPTRATPPSVLSSGSWAFKPVQVTVDLAAAGPQQVPLIVVPIPVPMPAAVTGAGCDASLSSIHSSGRVQSEQLPAQLVTTTQRPPFWSAPSAPAPLPPAPAVELSSEPQAPARLPPPLPDARYPPVSYTPEVDDLAPPPRPDPIASSQQLVDEFRAQTPRAPELPPMLLSSFDASERSRIPDGINALNIETEEKASSPAPPKVRTQTVSFGSRSKPTPSPRSSSPSYHSESLRLIRGQVTVPRADYTEPYAVWLDEKSGNSRVDFHDGSASSFRTVMPDGRVQRSLVWVQRSGGSEVRRCATAAAPPDATSRRHPALPDLTQFTFAGTEETQFGIQEVWQQTVEGRAGEQGAARGEVLTTHHEMRLARVDGYAVPLRYMVTVDSSVLGPNCDSYEHVYQPDHSQPIPPKFFDVDLEKVCDVVEKLNASLAEDLAKLEPLREFTLPHRDLRHDENFDKYQAQYSRQYADEREEAVRKNVLMQSTRFAAAGNRQGATSELGTTLLADRLRVEVRRMMGAEGAASALADGPARESFPYSREEVRKQEGRLPSGFDWRQRGGVSPVGFQGFSCASCWAFAVAGAVEGALFRRTRRLVPLSYQCLVDCAQPFGGRGCTGTWPSHAYNYVQARGLPALDEYPAYNEKVGQCAEQRVPSQTRISGHVNVTSNSVPALKIAIRKHAPSVVQVDAECQSFILHSKGVLYDDRCGKALRQLHHAVLAVGWGERKGEPHFILKNSWGAKWAEKGYIRVHARSNTCGVLTVPSYPLLEDGDVRQPLRAG